MILESFTRMTSEELRSFSSKYYAKYLQGKTVVNKHLGHKITFSSQGKNKLKRGSAVYAKKVAVVMQLKKILENAEYSNFGQRKNSDPKELIGYFNFKGKCKIGNKVENIRLATVLMKNGCIYYNHEINIIKNA